MSISKNHLKTLAIMLLALLLATLRQERLPDEDLGRGYVVLRVLSVEEGGNHLRLKAEIEGGEFPELYGRDASVRLYGAVDIPSKAFEMEGRVRVKGGRIYISGSHRDIRRVLATKESLRDRLIKRVDERIEDVNTRALFKSFILGESGDILSLSTQADFFLTGLVHLLVVSGFHVGMVALFLRYALPGRYGLYLALLGVILYSLLVVPPNPPVMRAGLMLSLVLISYILYARPDVLSILFLSTGVILFVKPEILSSYSLWLSFFATLYIILSLKDFKGHKLLLPFWVSLFAFLGSSPLIATFSLITPSSILFTPFVSPLFTAFGFYGFLDLLTYMSLPSFPLELLSQIILSLMDMLSGFSLRLKTHISTASALLLSVLNALILYFAKGYYKLLTLIPYLIALSL